MAWIIQLLLPLICAALAEAHPLDPPYFGIPGLQHPAHPNLDTDHKHPLDKNVKKWDHQSWLHNFMGHHPSLPDGDVHSYNRHHKEESYEDYNPFLNGEFDKYFGGPYGMDHFNPMSSITFPDMSNRFNTHDKGLNSHEPQPSQEVSNLEEEHKKESNNDIIKGKNPKEKSEEISPSNKTTTEKAIDSKPSDVFSPDVPKPEELPPKTNEMTKNVTSVDKADKREKEVDLNKQKDYLLVGSGSNSNNVYLLHENNPNPSTVVVPNANQPTNNVVYIPYYQGQNNNPVPQVVNQQPANQVSPNKITMNDYNNGVASPVQTVNSGNQNPGYVLVYSNGQLIQIPGVFVNSVQNNVPIQNSNPIQGTNYVIANAFPNNVQANPNPATNVIYASLPNQGSNSPILIQVPQCIHAMSNNMCSSGTVLQNPGVNNAAVVSNNGLGNAVYQPNQNVVTQPAVLLSNGYSNGYAQPTTIPQDVNSVVSVPSQGAVFSNQNGSPQLAVQLPANSGSNQYNQPVVTSLRPNTVINTPNQGAVNNQNVMFQPAVQIPTNISPGVYDNQLVQPNGATQNQGDSNQNLAIQPSVQVNGASNDQPQAPNQGNPYIVNTPNHDEAVNHPNIDIRDSIPQAAVPNNNGMAPDNNSLAALGGQPAIMISGFKENTDDNNDNKNAKGKKGKKDKSKKKNKKNKGSGESNEEMPLPNKKM